MALTHLMLSQFRNIQSCDLHLSPHFNFLIGDNGSGKTSVLEAIYLLGYGRSFKSSVTGRIINTDADELVVHAKLSTQSNNEPQRVLPLGIQKRRDGSNEIKIAGQTGQKVSQLAQMLPLQLIHTEGFELLTDGPKGRRAFIDWGLFHSQPAFFDAWSRLRRLLKQRNALLKTATHYQELSYWDKSLALLAEEVSAWRQDYVYQMSKVAIELCQQFLPQYEISMNYYRGWDKLTPYQESLASHFERDKQLGYTFSGPNKADLKIKANGMPVEDMLSRGQLKLMVCALRLAQGRHLTETTQKPCIYLIDDFASELDSQCRQRLALCLQQTQAQVFVSSIHASHIADMQGENSKMFHVEHGKIEQG